ncbi:MAG: CAP domain-containing protein [Myxococcales bacterium]|nr:CAP domain-containing protein [Myxococcales bacterium]
MAACEAGVTTPRAPGQGGQDARTIWLADSAPPWVDQGTGQLPPPPPPPPPGVDLGVQDTNVPQLRPDATVDTAPQNPGLQLTAQEQDLLQAINNARQKLGLSTLTPDPMLMCAARDASKVVPPSGNCGHVGADGSWPHDRAKRCGMADAPAWKVNEIAAGPNFNDGADAVWGWSQSSGHWWGLTHPQATKIGVSGTSNGCYWAVFDCCIKGS